MLSAAQARTYAMVSRTGQVNCRLIAALPAIEKTNSRWLKFGDHRGLQKQVLKSFRLKNTISAIDSTGYDQDCELKESVNQDSVFGAKFITPEADRFPADDNASFG